MTYEVLQFLDEEITLHIGPVILIVVDVTEDMDKLYSMLFINLEEVQFFRLVQFLEFLHSFDVLVSDEK